VQIFSYTGTGIQRLLAIILGVMLPLGSLSAGWAQQPQKHAFKSLAEHTQYKFTQQHGIEVGDVPGHQVRIFEVQGTFAKDPPLFEGVRAVERWVRGFSDYTDLNGRTGTYLMFVLENGDKIFARGDGVSQGIVQPDGAKQTTGTLVYTITGGTGKFLGMHGTIRETATFNPKVGVVEVQSEGEYWLER
jgi:hypothetical protein